MSLRVGIAAAAIVLTWILSPMTVLFVAAIVPVIALAGHGLDRSERRVLVAILVAAVVLRLLAVVGLFLSTDHSQVPYGSLFGDENYFIKRSLWLRNIAFDIPVHPFDIEYAFEANGRSSFLYALAFIQAFTGPAPYGVHLVGIFCYVLATVVLFRLMRTSFGRVQAAGALITLLFLPSLFTWSIAVLKESVFVLVGTLTLAVAVVGLRAGLWRHRLLALAALVALCAVQGTIRDGGAIFAAASVGAGVSIAFVLKRPRLLIATIVATPILAALVLRSPDVQLKGYVALQRAARQHWGAVVVSQGKGYELLDERFYADVNTMSDLGLGDAARFIARAAYAFVVLPRPWDAQSPVAAAYIPEQVVWYVLAAFVPIGILYGLRRDVDVTCLLVTHAVLIAVASAVTDGNVGTLVRHRGLALPFLVWLSVAGFCSAAVAIARSGPSEMRSL